MADRSDSSESDAAGESDATDESGRGAESGREAVSGRETEGDDGDDSDHLADIEDGAGCAEIWERLSERREAATDESDRGG